jgi:hypothetical protein
MIKRKINNHHYSSTDDTELSEIFRDEKDFRNLSKKNLEEVYKNLLKNIDELTKRQGELEGKIENLSKKNEEYIAKNKIISEELANKR